MSAPVTTTPQPPLTPWQWPEDVRAFAAENGAESYLDPLLEALRRIFPNPKAFRVYIHQDPELRDVRFICFEVHTRGFTLDEARTASKQWNDALFSICPAPKVPTFCLFHRQPNA